MRLSLLSLPLIFFISGCGEPECQKVKQSLLNVLSDNEILREPYKDYKISKSGAVDFYWGEFIKKMIAVQFVKDGKPPVDVVIASSKLRYPAMIFAADKNSYRVLDIGDPKGADLNSQIEEWGQAKKCMMEEQN